MRVTIIASDGKIGVDGEFREVDLTGLDSTIHAVQWDSVSAEGEVEYTAPRRNERITDFSPYQVFVDRWNAVPPPPPEPPEPNDPSDDLASEFRAMKGTGATVDDLIDLMLGAGGKARIAGRPV